VPSLVPVEFETDGDENVQQKMSQMSIESVQAPFETNILLSPEDQVKVGTEEEKVSIEVNAETTKATILEKVDTYVEAPLLPGPFNEPRKRQKKSVR
jgi:hypothetical protein